MRALALLLLGLLLLAAPAAAKLLQKPDYAREGAWWLYLRLPEGPGPFPLVVFLPGCAGWGAWERQSAAAHQAALAKAGWALAELDVLEPRGLASICASVTNLEVLRDDAALAATEAAQALAADPRIEGARIVFMGQSFGGSIALDIASPQRRKASQAAHVFAAVVPYYPWCYERYGLGVAADFDTPILVLGGALDAWTPVSQCVTLAAAQAARENPTPFVVESYPEAYHSFDLDEMPRYEIRGVDGTQIVAGNPAAAAASRERYLQWLAEIAP